ncbi:hypothetical protein AcV7_010360 [Taiwanofungus camphoratus]|nr:hypothetical protein AcV7_010360 [Antrodia cinnamomea]
MGERPTTPVRGKANTLTTNFETPAIAKHTSTASYVTGNLNQGRTALLIDIGESVPQISIESFLNNILPPLPEEVDVDEVIAKLKKQGHITRSNRWRAFTVDPRHSRLTEDKAFDPLKEISNAIVKATAKLTRADYVLELQNNPNVIPSSYTRSSKTRPDGCLILRRRGDAIRWADIGLSCEYKKLTSKKEEYDNVSKVIWSMHHCMRDDPRRRFTFGLTIEDTRMKLWFCSRAELLVSDSFDFMHEHRIVTSFFISLMYAKEHEIGWDPTMKFAKDGKGKIQYHSDGTPRYDITVRTPEAEEVVYHTIGVLSDVGANAPLGRGTRVWEARKVVGNKEYGDPVALKDSWIDSDRDREGDLSASLRDSASSEEDREDIDARFLTVLHHGDVYIDGNADDTRTLMTRSMEIPSECSRYNVHVPPEDILSGSNTGTGHYRTPQEYRQKTHKLPPTHHPKAHYRIVFKEVCKPLYKITSLALILKVLSHILHALQLMHRSGWVHRDISTGNILVDKDGNGRLGDLEYAKRMGQPSSHEVRTGTADFIAVEVDTQEYQFTLVDGQGTFSRDDDDKNNMRSILTAPRKHQDRKKYVSTRTDIAFRYNPLHDLESAWWVAVYFLFKRKVVHDSDEHPAYKESLADQMVYAGQLFYNQTKRLSAMLNSRTFPAMLPCLHRDVQGLGQVLEDIRRELAHLYWMAEQNITAIDHQVAGLLHQHFAQSILEISDLCVEVGPLSPELRQDHQAQTKDEPEEGSSKQDSRKRQREEVEEDRDNIEESTSRGSGSRNGSPSTAPPQRGRPTSKSKKKRCQK